MIDRCLRPVAVVNAAFRRVITNPEPDAARSVSRLRAVDILENYENS